MWIIICPYQKPVVMTLLADSPFGLLRCRFVWRKSLFRLLPGSWRVVVYSCFIYDYGMAPNTPSKLLYDFICGHLWEYVAYTFRWLSHSEAIIQNGNFWALWLSWSRTGSISNRPTPYRRTLGVTNACTSQTKFSNTLF